MPVAIITGASRGLGLATALELSRRGWELVIDGRDADRLMEAAYELWSQSRVHAVPGDVSDASHRLEVGALVRCLGRVDLLVNNASILGPSPQPALASYPIDELARVHAVNALAPLALVQEVLPQLISSGGTVINISSDAGVESYPGWGGYGSSKATLDHLTATLAAEIPEVRFYAFDPGEMRTALHQEATPAEDISGLAEPETVVPALLELVDSAAPSGRFRASDFLVATGSSR